MSVKQNRVKVGTHYRVGTHSRGVNKRNVYLIDGYYYAYHPQYAEERYTPLTGELKGYIPVNKEAAYGTFNATNPERIQKYTGQSCHRPAEGALK